jgi:hypothetical protein
MYPQFTWHPVKGCLVAEVIILQQYLILHTSVDRFFYDRSSLQLVLLRPSDSDFGQNGTWDQGDSSTLFA